jgi:FkbM family methyltransferase
MAGLWKPFLAGPARHAARLLTDGEYRSTCRLESALGRAPRRSPRRVRVHGLALHVPDAASFLASYREIFLDRSLAFPWEGPTPRILDLGANLGLSVAYFKRRHPNARITAFEADPEVYRYLEENVRENRLGDVELRNEAVWDEPGRVSFRPDGADGGRALPADAAGGNAGTIDVPAIDLRAFLSDRADRAFDVIKMDIEGAESRVLPAISDRLGGVRYLFVEYHSRPDEPQALDRVLGAMAGAGFRLQIHSVLASPTPFLGTDARRDPGQNGAHDLILHLYGSRP